MNIAIIGGGWVGCHLGMKLKDYHNITIFEKNDLLFSETSFNNQNRLHLGYHYARNSKTRLLCKTTFDRFISDYGFITKKLPKNYYCVPKKTSLLDLETYKLIFGINSNEIENLNFLITEGCFKTDERYIDFQDAQTFFNQELKNIWVKQRVDEKTCLNKFDYIINSTNNVYKKIQKDSFFELTLTLKYKKNKTSYFDALTMVDGLLFSIFPYDEEYVTLTDVENTPLYKSENLNDIEKFKKKVNNSYINKKVSLFENKVLKYFPEFKQCFEYQDYILSLKSKFKSLSDDRYPIIHQENNFISCFTGKIQGIYIIEDSVKKIIGL